MCRSQRSAPRGVTRGSLEGKSDLQMVHRRFESSGHFNKEYMDEDKKFTLDEETLQDQLDKLSDMMDSDKKAIAENDAIARDPSHIFDCQGEWAEARKRGNLDALNRHEELYEETKERLDQLKDSSNQES